MSWFRMYGEAAHDPKVQRLEPVLFKHWFNILCLASENDGVVPDPADLSWHLRVDEAHAVEICDELLGLNLLDLCDGALKPHNWEKRQFKSDSSAERTRHYRDRVKRHGDVTVTPPEQNRTEQNITEEVTADAVATSLPECPFAWQGQVIKLNHSDYNAWAKSYSHLDLPGELLARDTWLIEQDYSVRRKWFASTSKYLANRNMEAKAREATAPPSRSKVVQFAGSFRKEFGPEDEIAILPASERAAQVERILGKTANALKANGG